MSVVWTIRETIPASPKKRYIVECCQFIRSSQCFSAELYNWSLGPSANCSAKIPGVQSTPCLLPLHVVSWIQAELSNLLSTSKSIDSFFKIIWPNLSLRKLNLPTREKKTTTELSIISSRCCKPLLASRLEPMFLFLRVTCQSECFPVHQSPATRKKLPGSAWPLKLPMTYTAYKKCTNSRKCLDGFFFFFTCYCVLIYSSCFSPRGRIRFYFQQCHNGLANNYPGS